MSRELTQNPFGQLLALHEDIQPQEYILHDPVCTIGRAGECQIVVPRKVVSRLHARIERAGSRYILVDAGSVNGTFVNNQQIHAPYMLNDRDLIGLGAMTAVLRFLDPDPTLRSTRRLQYDQRAMRFVLNDQPVDLTPAQLRLLLHLYQHAGAVCTREELAESIWGRDYDPGMDAAALDRAMNNLRSRLREVDPYDDLIETRRGLGYVLNL